MDDFQPQDIVGLANALAWPLLTLLFFFLFGDSLRSFLLQIAKKPIKTITTPVASMEFLEEKIEQELKDAITLEHDDEPIRLDADSVKEAEQRTKLNETMWNVVNLEVRVRYLEQMVQWILTNNTGFANDFSHETREKFIQEALGDVRKKYPELFN